MVAIVFPGQGSQFLGMAKDFYNSFSEARDVFELVSNTTKIDIKDIIFEENSNKIDITEFTQLAIFCASLSIYSVFEKHMEKNLNKIEFFLGHSLGEYSAIAASKSVSISDCADLLKTRGKLMQEAFPQNESGMFAVLGPEIKIIENIIRENSNLNCEIANDNCPGQTVISGKIKDLNNMKIILEKNKAKKIIFLNVSAAFHSKIMINAENKMKDKLMNVDFSNSFRPIISNLNANSSDIGKEIKKNLITQMSNRVRWRESIEFLDNKSVHKVVEIGPGKVLSGLIKRISKKFEIININRVEDLEKSIKVI